MIRPGDLVRLHSGKYVGRVLAYAEPSSEWVYIRWDDGYLALHRPSELVPVADEADESAVAS